VHHEHSRLAARAVVQATGGPARTCIASLLVIGVVPLPGTLDTSASGAELGREVIVRLSRETDGRPADGAIERCNSTSFEFGPRSCVFMGRRAARTHRPPRNRAVERGPRARFESRTFAILFGNEFSSSLVWAHSCYSADLLQ